MVNIKVSWSNTADRDLGLPTYETVGGADLWANLPNDHRDAGIEISPGGRAPIPQDLRLKILWDTRFRYVCVLVGTETRDYVG